MNILTFSSYRKFKVEQHKRLINKAKKYRSLGLICIATNCLNNAAIVRTVLQDDIRQYNNRSF
jgi:hypothetical protein